jgi:hypothetical protein
LEWVSGFQPPYAHFDLVGGAGDKGRDIVAYTGQPNFTCDLDVYQCKHFDHPIQPNEIWRELGKLCYFTHAGSYRVPRRYRIVAPRGVGGSLADLLAKPEDLRSGLIEHWNAKCMAQITRHQNIPLTGGLRQHVERFDFAIVGYIPVHELLEQHRTTPHWFQRFRRDPPVRPAACPAPPTVQVQEMRYVEQLMDAYGDNLGCGVSQGSLPSHPEHAAHFQRSR